MPRVANIAFCIFYRKRVVVLLQVIFILEIVSVVTASADPRASDRVRVDPIRFLFSWFLFFCSVTI